VPVPERPAAGEKVLSHQEEKLRETRGTPFAQAAVRESEVE
jgi:hypothetical protein